MGAAVAAAVAMAAIVAAVAASLADVEEAAVEVVEAAVDEAAEADEADADKPNPTSLSLLLLLSLACAPSLDPSLIFTHDSTRSNLTAPLIFAIDHSSQISRARGKVCDRTKMCRESGCAFRFDDREAPAHAKNGDAGGMTSRVLVR